MGRKPRTSAPIVPQPARRELGSWRAELLAFGAAVRSGDAGLRDGGETGGLTSGADGLATVAAMAAVLEAVEGGGEVQPAFILPS